MHDPANYIQKIKNEFNTNVKLIYFVLDMDVGETMKSIRKYFMENDLHPKIYQKFALDEVNRTLGMTIVVQISGIYARQTEDFLVSLADNNINVRDTKYENDPLLGKLEQQTQGDKNEHNASK